MEAKMRKLLTLLTISTLAFSAELPICEEFSHETNVSCVVGENSAIIITTHPNGKTYEIYKGDKKAYMEFNESYIYASDGKRVLELDSIPNSNTDKYISEVVASLVDAIDF
jgi:hypothetical protein